MSRERSWEGKEAFHSPGFVLLNLPKEGKSKSYDEFQFPETCLEMLHLSEFGFNAGSQELQRR